MPTVIVIMLSKVKFKVLLYCPLHAQCPGETDTEINRTVNFQASRFIRGTCPNRASNASFGQVVFGEHLPKGKCSKKSISSPVSLMPKYAMKTAAIFTD